MDTTAPFTDQQKRRYKDTMNSLLEFTNERWPSCVFFEGPIDSDAKVHRAQRIALDLWDHGELIDEFAASRQREGLQVDLDLARSWKHRLRGPFFHMDSQGYEALLMREGRVFKVHSFDRPWSSLSPIVPGLIHATLIPFEGRIVTDGFITRHACALEGPGVMRLFSEFSAALNQGIVSDSQMFLKVADVLESQRRTTGIDLVSFEFLRNLVDQVNRSSADPMFHYQLTDRVKCA